MDNPNRAGSLAWDDTAVDEVLSMLLGADNSAVLDPFDPPAKAECIKQEEEDGFATGIDAAGLCSGWSAANARTVTTCLGLQPSATLSAVDTLSASSNASLPRTATTGTSERSSSELLTPVPATYSRSGSQIMGSTLSTLPLPACSERRLSASQPLPLLSASFAHPDSQFMGSTLSTGPVPAHLDSMSWQELVLGMIDEPQLPPVKKPRGRKPTISSITKPCKDRKKENSMKIKELEAELQTKLSLVTQLEGQNDELKRRERLLRLSVDASEHNMSKLVNHQLPPTLRELLMSFRNTYNRANAERILSKVSSIQQPQDMTIDIFRSTWQALIMELSDVLINDSLATTPEAKAETEAHLSRLTSQVNDYVAVLCAHGCQIISRAQSTSMLTGEEVSTDVTFWADVAEKLALSDEQAKDMLGAWEMFTRALKQNSEERNELKVQLDHAVGKRGDDSPECPGYSSNYCCAGGCGCYGGVSISSVMEKLAANLQRFSILHTIMSFVAVRIMTPRQVAQMCMHSSPLFPNVIAVLQGVAMRRGQEKSYNMMAFDRSAAYGVTPFHFPSMLQQGA